MHNGKVFLIGAGPGDVGLLTLKAKRYMSEADVILYDYLAGDEIIAFARVDAELIYVGKKAGHHTLKQDEINRLLVDKAKKGKRVVRLKGGDPFLFGRGGEEALFLVEHGIPFEIVPGVTSAIAVPAYAGIPVTHREYASSLCVVTGHESIDKASVPWKNIVGIETIVILMGVSNIMEIAKKLLEAGKCPDTPVAAICHGTTNRQKTITTTLDRVSRDASFIQAPAIIVVGKVVELQKQLQWFENKPLFGKGILVTRPISQGNREQARLFSARLQDLGAVVYEQPTIKIISPDSFDELDSAIKQIRKYQWLIFTSVNGVIYFMQRLKVCGMDIRELYGIKIAAIGPQTKLELERYCLNVDYCPDEFVAEALVEGLKKYDKNGQHILIPRAKDARNVLENGLREQGAIPHVVAAYQTIIFENERIKDLLLDHRIDVVTLTSPSCVKGFCSIFDGEDMQAYLSGVRIACIGPITQRAAIELNLRVDTVANEYTADGLIEAILG
ncbi:uroporphyrinogen-III C-methyltransferase [bacterium]|nr:uroporphyrinogen-III C-methyltransferase [bacterium]MBU1752275.1 uroporphyrinogen-III C-methyltransferase [bacterium]